VTALRVTFLCLLGLAGGSCLYAAFHFHTLQVGSTSEQLPRVRFNRNAWLVLILLAAALFAFVLLYRPRRRLTVTLRLGEKAPHGFTFEVLVRNESRVNLLLPRPKTKDLHFQPVAGSGAATWAVRKSISGGWAGWMLEPGETAVTELRVHLTSSETAGLHYDTAYCLELTPGQYRVSLRYKVDRDYFDPISHTRMAELRQWAKEDRAEVWTGDVESNAVRVTAT